jgi:predicted cupin superfamily sugar epimerase
MNILANLHLILRYLDMIKDTKDRPSILRNALKMQPHPEGGYYCRTYESGFSLRKDALPEGFSSDRSLSSAIYFLLEGDEISSLHRIKSDEIWHFYEGSPLQLSILSPSGGLNQRTLGPNIEFGEEFQIVVPAGMWMGARVCRAGSYSFFGCTVSPGFNLDDFELGQKEHLLKLFPEHKVLINALSPR